MVCARVSKRSVLETVGVCVPHILCGFPNTTVCICKTLLGPTCTVLQKMHVVVSRARVKNARHPNFQERVVTGSHTRVLLDTCDALVLLGPNTQVLLNPLGALDFFCLTIPKRQQLQVDAKTSIHTQP